MIVGSGPKLAAFAMATMPIAVSAHVVLHDAYVMLVGGVIVDIVSAKLYAYPCQQVPPAAGMSTQPPVVGSNVAGQFTVVVPPVPVVVVPPVPVTMVPPVPVTPPVCVPPVPVMMPPVPVEPPVCEPPVPVELPPVPVELEPPVLFPVVPGTVSPLAQE